MTHWILAVEDDLSAHVGRRLLHWLGQELGALVQRNGFGYLRSRIREFNQIRGAKVLLITDLDAEVCASALRAKWLKQPISANLHFRVAIREIEAWLLADVSAISTYFGIRPELVPEDVESLRDPKQKLVDLARHSKNSELRKNLVPAPGRTVKVGPLYNSCLGDFVHKHWSPDRARKNSQSLDRTLCRLSG